LHIWERAGDVVELLDARDAEIAKLRSALEESQRIVGELKSDDLPQLRQDIVWLMRSRNQYRKALEFYADHSNWTPHEDAHGHRQRPAMVYKWKHAEQALSGGKDEKSGST
jgi:hypothetical protein